MTKLAWISLALLCFATSAEAQTERRRPPTYWGTGGGGGDTNLDYVGTTTTTASGATQIDITYSIPSGHTNKAIVYEIGAENYGSVSLTSIKRQDTGTDLTEIASQLETSGGRQWISMRYILDTNLPTDGNVTIRAIFSSAVDAAVRVRLYNGALQSASFATNSDTDLNCGGTSSSLSVDGNTLGWTWTTNSCEIAVGAKLNGSSSGSQIVTALCLDGDQGSTGITETGTGHTSLGSITSVLPRLYSAYK